MSDALFSSLELNTVTDARTGYRLHRLEVVNWGTFDRHVWSLDPGGHTSLLTGDIGSGKSTLVDAITTLMLPANKIAYNKAAGAETKERTLRSYVEGHYRSERNESTGTSRAVGLRDHRSYSVILGVFVNEGFGDTVSIAQVFHQKDRAGQPDRFYITASRQLSIQADFSDFGSDLKSLRARLRTGGANIDTTFPDYSRRMRRLLGIRSEQAMELFHQTISMKSVGNLNDFVRGHMLEPADASRKVRTIVSHFENLTKAHDAVRTATEQLELLTPLVTSGDKYTDAHARHRQYSLERQAMIPFIADLTLDVLRSTSATLHTDLQQHEDTQHDLEAQRDALTRTRDSLAAERIGAGGDRLAALDVEIPRAERLTAERASRRRRFDEHLENAGLGPVTTPAEFRERLHSIAEHDTKLKAERREIEATKLPLLESQARARRSISDADDEITSLEQRVNNMPRDLVRVREELCSALAQTEKSLPFAGELIDVRPEFAEWRGAAERVLRPFATTLLVPQALYARATEWINDHHLGARLVFVRVPDRQVRTSPITAEGGTRLRDILEIEPGEFAGYLHSETARRAEHLLVENVVQLQSEDRAVTREGLIRDRDRHEKDDRFRVSDPRRWVLGRSSEAKIQALREEIAELERTLRNLVAQLRTIDEQEQRTSGELTAITTLRDYTNWDEIDEDAARNELAALVDERARVLAGSTRLAEIDRQLTDIDEHLQRLGSDIGQVLQRIGGIKNELTALQTRKTREERLLSEISPDARTAAAEHFDALQKRIGTKRPRSVDECDETRTRLVDELARATDAAQREMNGYTTAIQQQMSEVLRRWPELRSEMDASIHSLDDFRALHNRVRGDDLPRFEAEFKRLLNTEAIRELAQFNNWLLRQSEEIRRRIERINEALGAIDYNPGRKIELSPEATINQDVREFRSDLRAATGDLIAEDDENLEQRFERVRKLIERFRGREGHTDRDRAWVTRVTDVRNWFTFAAAEVDRETGTVHEHYTDSDGKSGGQKEKLAYTILAASLAYQFGLEWGVEKSKDFRFAVIDEAFGRGSDTSTRYALELFAKLGLQLLIVTPLQKVHVIEPYVHSIGFVDVPGDVGSRVHTITVEEFQAKRAAQS